MKNDKKAKSWFVIIIGDNERRGPFEVTRRALVLSSVCLLAVLAGITAGGSWLYSRPYVISHNELVEELATARQSVEMISREKESFSEEIERLKTKIEASHARRENPVAVETKKGAADVTAAAEKKAAVEVKSFVSLEEMQIAYSEDNKTFKIRFIIRNQSAGDDYISGYVFILLNPASGSSALRKCYPTVELVGGFPRSYKRGENFSIARFKYIEGVFPSISDRTQYASVSILVYADDGTLRLKEEVSL